MDAGGYRVHIYCKGQGSPTVVVASGGFSFDWGLVQPEITQSTRVCTYDTAGTAWSDPLPAQSTPTCAYRIDELHKLLSNAGIHSPYVLVGFSIGGLIARLYAATYPDEISGMVFLDHAFIDTGGSAPSKAEPPTPAAGLDSPPVLISTSPIELDLEDDQNFSRLSKQNQELHRWALLNSARPTPEMAAQCFSEVGKAERTYRTP